MAQLKWCGGSIKENIAKLKEIKKYIDSVVIFDGLC